MREIMRSVFNAAIRRGVVGYKAQWVWRKA